MEIRDHRVELGAASAHTRGIDSHQAQAERGHVKRWYSLLLMMGALLGLLSQEAAFAHVIPVAKAEQTVVASNMSADCAEMMGLAKQAPQPEKPCKGMTPDCIAKMGCAIPMALIPSVTLGKPLEFRDLAPPLTSVTALVGRDTGPEPEPPAHLG